MNVRSLFTAAFAAGAVALAGAQQPPLKSGLDPASFDKSVRPQDDLFRYVNGAWLAKTPIPADRAVYGTFVQLSDKAEADLYALIEELAGDKNKKPGSTAQQVGDLYMSFTNETKLNEIGAAPLKPRLAKVDAIKNTTEFAQLLGEMSMTGLPGAVGGFIEADAGDPTRPILYLGQGGTALPDRDYYLKDDKNFIDTRAKYVAYLDKVFTLAGRAKPADDAKTVLALETELARIQWTQVESRDAVKTYNKMQLPKLDAEMPGFAWSVWAKAQGLDNVTDVVINQPSFFKSFAAMVPTTPLESWKTWLAAQVITQNAGLMSAPFSDAAFEFFGKALSGQEVQRPRWKRGVQLVNGNMGEALGQLYVAKHYPASARARMKTMIDNLIEAYRQSITNLDWMTAETKKEALAKLAKFEPKIGYPEKWRDYSKLSVKADDLVGNVERSTYLESEYQIGKLARPVDREEWLMTPQTINAYYNPVKNEIVFPAAILQAPFFDVTADDAANYGAIGAVIGHEIGHGFDDQGSSYDGDGKLRDWWTPADKAEFKKRTGLLVEQFNAFKPLPDVNVNGELTLGENIGDLGGLAIAHQAWKIALKGQPSPVIDGLTGEQRFFMGWAQAWRAKARDEYLRRQVLADPHAWAEFRANGPLGNIPEFYEAFGVKPGDKLYREPEKRVKIW
ncbi:MAG TPA: M13-type metalloendopeptidase [Vicinamibacterales bacterium]|nr:M13-type metalloendopeptidase [Vicinamibacterales bacterium]